MFVFSVLTKDAFNGPHVNTDGVMCGTEKNLRFSVPEGDNLMSVAIERNSEGTSKAKLSDLENPLLLIEKEVLWLEIAVEDAMAVALSDVLAKLEEEALNEGWAYRLRGLVNVLDVEETEVVSHHERHTWQQQWRITNQQLRATEKKKQRPRRRGKTASSATGREAYGRGRHTVAGEQW
ncbi:hypothetical protein SESBI_42895 [Sesbania bispinosa]|nr:hypothetical protein SESBI_42895 [Sesbania bispinosa]